MSSNRKSFSHDRGIGKGGYGRRDSGDGREAWKKGIKCLNFKAQTGVRTRDCQPGCGFAHPTDPEWSTAAARKPGSMGPPKDIPSHARDPPRARDSGWNRGVSSRPSAPRTDRPGDNDLPTASVWATTIDATPFKLFDTGTKSASSSGWGTGWEDGESTAVDTNGGWGLPEPPVATPAASSALDGWGIAGPAAPTISPDFAANVASAWGIVSDTGGLDPQEVSTSTGMSKGWGPPAREVALAVNSTPALASEGSRADKGWTGMAEKRGVPPLPASRPTLTKAENSSNPPQPSTLYTGFSFGKSHSRRSSMDNVNTPGRGNGTTVVNTPLDNSDRRAEERPEEATTVVLPSPTLPNVPPPRSHSTTPKPSLKIVLPSHPPEHQSAALSLLLRSPFTQPTHSSPTRGEATMKSPQQIAWSAHIEVLSRAVTAQMERMQLDNAINDRQRLISRITQKSGRSTAPKIPENMHENKTQDADAKLQAAMAALAQTNAEADQRWWSTPRAGVDYEQVLSSLESDIENLQQLLGEPDAAKDDEMEIDIPDSAEFEKLRKKRRSLFREVQNMLPYIAERLRTTESFVENQNEGLNGQISPILDESHPPNATPGASGLAKLEDIRERFEKVEGRMNAYLPDLRRRRALAIQRATDLKTLKSRYEELRRNEQELVSRKKKFTKEAQELLANMTGGPTMEERVLQLSTSPVAQERMMRVMVPKLLEIANTYRTEDLEYAVQCQVTAKTEVEAWRLAREEKRKLRGEALLKGLENESAIKAVERAGKEIDRRWNEVISVQKAPQKPPAIRIPGTG